eukprot:scaffold11677_cov98-Cylindrotheca_fusiformis.AAC.2
MPIIVSLAVMGKLDLGADWSLAVEHMSCEVCVLRHKCFAHWDSSVEGELTFDGPEQKSSCPRLTRRLYLPQSQQSTTPSVPII